MIKPARLFDLFPGYIFQSINDILTTFHHGDDVFKFIDSKMFPFFTSGHSDYLTLNLHEVLERNLMASVYYISAGDTNFRGFVKIYENFNQMLITVIDCYVKGYYFLDDDGILDDDSIEVANLSFANNPLSPYWKRMLE
ncbi:MAG: hypothetical protein H7Y00_05665 [Fimbriimonadaceae bacterium]|nr:hypothetical protein [Chitinophagales bacterium]